MRLGVILLLMATMIVMAEIESAMAIIRSPMAKTETAYGEDCLGYGKNYFDMAKTLRRAITIGESRGFMTIAAFFADAFASIR